jgi:Na+/proline symporter
LASLCLIPEEIIAGGKILSSLTPISTPAGMGITAFVVVVPVVIGGMKADVATDTVQFILMMLMLVLLLPIVLSPHQWSIPSGHVSPFSALTVQEMGVFFVSLFFLPITSAPLYQRFFASESAACARRSLLISIGIWIAIDAVVVVCGFSALAMFPDLADPDLSLIVLGTKLPVAARPVFLVGALAAILSTVNSFLQSGASSLGYDVLKHLRPSMQDRQILIVSRFLVVVLGLASLSIAVWFQEIVPALMFTLSMWTAGILVPTLAALAGVRLKKPAALCSLVGGVLSYVGWEIWRPCAIDPLFVGLAASLLLSLTVRLMDNRSR